MQQPDNCIDLFLARERLAAPRSIVVAPLDQLLPSKLQLLEGRRIVPGIPPSQSSERAPQTRRRLIQPLFEPGAKSPLIQTAALLLVQFFKCRIDTRLHRPLPQNLRAEGMDGADGSLFQATERVLKNRRCHAGSV